MNCQRSNFENSGFDTILRYMFISFVDIALRTKIETLIICYIRYMRSFIFVCLTIFSFVSFGQKPVKFKRKYRGDYEGVVPGYTYQNGVNTVEVGSASIRINITSDSVFVYIGKLSYKGVYNVMFKADTYLLLECDMDGVLANEKLLVYTRGKKISRDGIFPQPVTELKKVKSK